ncbi:methyltransferase domain-containing protein [Actinomadura viridis]|uniref:Phospholipid N-methyltransferase n=1 Tax=Actinomadura viridis TaxID=58110 RepID=A0A931DNA6_9ACTN|nr:methyltransferase domain-containing protein [Actinomadura viridis]MBG6092722.1 phospholipid N-methyltransferase [Actinomadura viridis]
MSHDGRILLREFLRDPLRVGAVAPSGRRLATVLARVAPLGGHVIELGPGTGAVTEAIRRREPERQLALEVNPRLAGLVARRWPEIEVACADAAELSQVLEARDAGRADAVISSLPWAVMPGDQQRAVMRAVQAALTDAGCFTTYAYVHAMWTPAARRLPRMLAAAFTRVTVSPVVWANMPPAVVYRAHGPRPEADR